MISPTIKYVKWKFIFLLFFINYNLVQQGSWANWPIWLPSTCLQFIVGADCPEDWEGGENERIKIFYITIGVGVGDGEVVPVEVDRGDDGMFL